MVHNTISAQAAQEKADALKTKISQVIFRYQTGANKEKLVSEAIQMIAAVSPVFDSPDYPGAITCPLSKTLNEVYQLLSGAEVISGLTMDTALENDPHTFANILNAEIDSLIAEREHISRCEYDDMTEYQRLASWQPFYYQENRREFYGEDLLAWLKNTARNLWEEGYYPRRYLQHDPELWGCLAGWPDMRAVDSLFRVLIFYHNVTPLASKRVFQSGKHVVAVCFLRYPQHIDGRKRGCCEFHTAADFCCVLPCVPGSQ